MVWTPISTYSNQIGLVEALAKDRTWKTPDAGLTVFPRPALIDRTKNHAREEPELAAFGL